MLVNLQDYYNDNEDWISCIGYNVTSKRGYVNNTGTKRMILRLKQHAGG